MRSSGAGFRHSDRSYEIRVGPTDCDAKGKRFRGSADEFFHDVAVHVGEAEVAAGEAIGQLLVIEAHQVQHGGVQVVDVDFLFHGREAAFVGGSVDVASLGAAAGQPHGEAVVVVVAAVDLARVGPFLRQLDGRRAAEFAAANHQSLVEQAALFEVGQEGARWPSRCRPARLL